MLITFFENELKSDALQKLFYDFLYSTLNTPQCVYEVLALLFSPCTESDLQNFRARKVSATIQLKALISWSREWGPAPVTQLVSLWGRIMTQGSCHCLLLCSSLFRVYVWSLQLEDLLSETELFSYSSKDSSALLCSG